MREDKKRTGRGILRMATAVILTVSVMGISAYGEESAAATQEGEPARVIQAGSRTGDLSAKGPAGKADTGIMSGGAEEATEAAKKEEAAEAAKTEETAEAANTEAAAEAAKTEKAAGAEKAAEGTEAAANNNEMAESPVTSALAAGWNQVGDNWYYGNEEGGMQTGWVQADNGLWYYFDTVTGSWVKRPLLDHTGAVHLLENGIKKLGYYEKEEYPVEVRENWRSDTHIYLSVCIITGPNSYTALNNYEVDKRSGRVKAAAGESFNIYDY